jgi:uncharacterized protein YndB with AHSA1/START domain
MIEVRWEGRLAAPVDEVWAVVQDPQRMGRWLAFADRIEVIDDEHRRLHGEFGRQRAEIDIRITDVTPPRRLAWEHEAERLGGKPAPVFAKATRFAIELEPSGEEETVVRLVSQQEPVSAMKAFAIRAGNSSMRKALRQSLKGLAVQVGKARSS